MDLGMGVSKGMTRAAGPGFTGLARDRFGRPDSSTDLGAAETGQIWQQERGVWGIDAGRARVYGAGAAGSYPYIATIDVGKRAGLTVEADLTRTEAPEDHGLVLGFSSTTSYLLYHITDTSAAVDIVVNGTRYWAGRAGAGGLSFPRSATYHILAEFLADEFVRISVNGVAYPGGILSAEHQASLTGTRVGFYIPAASLVDNLEVYEV